MIVILVIWNLLLTWYVVQHVKIHDRSMQAIVQAIPGLQIVKRRRQF